MAAKLCVVIGLTLALLVLLAGQGAVVTAIFDHLSHFAVLGKSRRIYLPVVLKNYP